MRNVVRTLWRGDVSLGRTFWLWGVLGGFISAAVAAIPLLIWVSLDYLLGIVIVTVYQLFIAIAVWKSAGKYQGRKFWFVLARISTIGTFLNWAKYWYQFSS